MGTTYEIFAAVTPGLEHLLSQELAELQPRLKTQLRRGGVEFRGDQALVWRVLMGSRLTETLRVRIGRFKARNFKELEAGLRRVPWAAYLAQDIAVNVQVSARKSALYHSGAIAERVAHTLGRPVVGPDEAQVRLWVRLASDRATVSVDAGGGLLHRRGWRTAVGRAPLRETLAAACVRLAGLSQGQALWDPFCGAGTIPIEAALRATGQVVQPDRRFAFQDWPTFDADQVAAVAQPAQGRETAPQTFWGSEVSEETLAAARGNAERAGVHEACAWMAGDFEGHLESIPRGAAVISNPPYGKRLKGGAALERLWVRLGQVLARRVDLDPVVMLVGTRRFEEATGLSWTTLAEFTNRGTPTRLVGLTR